MRNDPSSLLPSGPVAATLTVGGFRVSVHLARALHKPQGPAPCQDAWSAGPWIDGAGREGLRAAVIDGVTPGPGTPPFAGVDGAIGAAVTVQASLAAPGDAVDALRSANRQLLRPDILPARDRPQATAVVADISPDGRATVIRASDCEAWVRDVDGAWACLFPRAMRSWARVAWRAILDADPRTSDPRHRMSRESEVWDDPDAWESHPIGRFADPRLECVDLAAGTWTALLLATDGAGTRDRSSTAIAAIAAALVAGAVPVPDEERTDDVCALLVEHPARADGGSVDETVSPGRPDRDRTPAG